jgi:hypothetical protein
MREKFTSKIADSGSTMFKIGIASSISLGQLDSAVNLLNSMLYRAGDCMKIKQKGYKPNIKSKYWYTAQIEKKAAKYY